MESGLAGKNGVPPGLVNNSWDTFAPRVGFAFDLTGHQKTILRAGTGMFYERLGGNEMYNLIQNSVPFAYSSSPNNVYLDNPAQSWTTGQAAGASPYFPDNIWTLGQGYKVPTSLQWSLGIQHQLAQNVVLSVSYVGNSNFHQSEGININPINRAIQQTAWLFAAVFAVIPAFPPTLTSTGRIRAGEPSTTWKWAQPPTTIRCRSASGPRSGRA